MIPAHRDKSNIYFVISRATKMKTIQRNTLKNIINISKWNTKNYSSNTQEENNRETGMRIRENKQEINNKMAGLCSKISTITWNVDSLNIQSEKTEMGRVDLNKNTL